VGIATSDRDIQLREADMAGRVKVPCLACGAVNRVTRPRLGEAVCGRCRERLLPAAPLDVEETSFERLVGTSELPVVVDFWAPWCGPCRVMAPAFATVAQRLAMRAHFVKVNTDEAQVLGSRYRIQSIPTTVVFAGGDEVARQPGAMDAATLQGWIEGHL
jgi:thioredoxin 2